MYSPELRQSHFTEPPKVLYSVDMVMSIGKFILSMFDSIMLFISKIRQSIISLKSIGINNRIGISLALNNGQQLACRQNNLKIVRNGASDIFEYFKYLLGIGS